MLTNTENIKKGGDFIMYVWPKTISLAWPSKIVKYALGNILQFCFISVMFGYVIHISLT